MTDVAHARRSHWEPRMPASKRPLLTRSEIVFVFICTAGVATPLLALTGGPSGWVLVLDGILSGLLGLMIAVVVAAVVRFVEGRLKGG